MTVLKIDHISLRACKDFLLAHEGVFPVGGLKSHIVQFLASPHVVDYSIRPEQIENLRNRKIVHPKVRLRER